LGYAVRFEAPQGGRATYKYSVVLEPHNRFWLFALESAASLPPSSRMSFDGQVLSSTPVRSRLRYDMVSMIAPRQEAAESRGLLGRALRLPPGYNKRAIALGQEWRAAGGTDVQILERALNFMRTGKFTYTLEPPLLGQDSVDEFLFETKAGFCEHFSSSFTVLMRAAGIPARVVTGYQGGDLNPVDFIMTVRLPGPRCTSPAAAGCASIRRRRPCRGASMRDLRARCRKGKHRSCCGRKWHGCAACATSGKRSRTSGTCGCSATAPTGSAT
jgi:transglutaminase-like putative cysteine protease